MEEINKKFLDFYNLYSNDVLRLAFSFTKNIFESEDIVQSVFIKLYQELKKDYDKDFGKKWLLKVTANECKNSFKIAWRKKVILQDEVLQNEVDLRETLKNDEVSDALLKLSAKYRNVIYLYYYEGYKIDEISEILNLKLSNVKTLLSRGREKIKRIWRKIVMNKKLKFFDELKTTENLKQKILNQTINIEKGIKPKKTIKLAYGLGVFVLILFISCTVVFAAGYIRTFFINKTVDENGWYKQSFVVDKPAVLNDIKSFDCKQGMKLEEIEKYLGLEFINNDRYNNIIDSCEIKTTNDGKVEYVSLDIYEYVDFSAENNKIDGYDSDRDDIEGYNKGKHISLNISFMTSNASSEVKEIFSNLNEVGSDNEIYGKEIQLDKLNTIAYYYCPFGSRDGRCKISTNVIIVHNNIVYMFNAQGVSLDNILEVIK